MQHCGLVLPLQSFLPIGSEVPIDKKSSFPPGEAKKRTAVGCSQIISQDSLLQWAVQNRKRMPFNLLSL